MPRISKLKPTEVQSRKRRGLAAWCVNVPEELSDTGTRRQLFFSTKRDAEAECERLKARKDNFGLSLSAMTPVRIAEASEAYKLLDERHAVDPLVVIVRQYLAQTDRRGQSVTLDALFDEYVAERSHRAEKYLAEINKARKPLEALKDRLVCDLAPTDLQKALSAISAGNRNAVMRYLRAMFNHGVKRGYLAANPIAKMDFAHRQRKEVETIEHTIVYRMLKHALDQDLELLPFLVLGFFCGIRPDGELQKLLWPDLELNDKLVTIRSEVSKTKRKRFVDLSPNAIAWLRTYRLSGGSTEGKIVPFSSITLRRKRRTNWRAAAGEECAWIQQGMRHTFCSNWLAKHEDINRLVLLSGHADVDTMWRHYHRGVKKANAAKFWAIQPPKETARPRNVISIAA
jgi:integrase